MQSGTLDLRKPGKIVHQLQLLTRKMKKILQIIIACILLCGPALAQTQKIPLENGWKFHEYSGSKPELSEWRSATVPGLIHTDLLTHKLIPDPFYRDNENKVQRVSSMLLKRRSGTKTPLHSKATLLR